MSPETAPRKVSLTLVLGRRRLSVAQADLHRGDVVELDRPDQTGEVEVYADGRLLGCGVAVDVDGHLAVRLTQLSGISL